MKLLSLDVIDFCCFANFELSLQDMGLVLISGRNHDTQAAGNNGSGKSTIFKALTWCLYGKTIDGERGDKVIRDGCKKTTVSVVFESVGERWTVIRERGKGAPDVKIICPDGCDFSGNKNDIQDKIEQLLGLDFLTFKNSVMYGQNDSNRFIRPETSDADRKAVLHKILGIELFAECCSLARNAKKMKISKLDAIEIKINENKMRLNDIDLESLRKLESEFDDEIENEAQFKLQQAQECAKKAKQAIKDLTKLEMGRNAGCDLDGIRGEIATLKSTIKQKVNENNQRRQQAADKLSNVQDEMRRCDSKLAKLRTEVVHIEDQLKDLDGDRCAVCNSLLAKGDAAIYIEKLNGELAKRSFALKKTLEMRGKLKIRLELNKQKCNAILKNDFGIEGMENRLGVLNQKLNLEHSRIQRLDSEKQLLQERVSNYKSSAHKMLQEMESIKSKVNNYTTMLIEAKDKKAKIEKVLRADEKLRDNILPELAKLEFWVKGFSNQGLPSFLMDSVVPYITMRANHYLGILTDHDIKLDFSTQRELKSGEHRDKIDIKWEIEGIGNSYSPSGGQWKKMEIAVDLALMDLVSNRSDGDLGLLILDEILDGLDVEGKLRVVDLLEYLKQHKQSIFVITHDPDVAGVFEQMIVVDKTKSVSSLRMVN